MKKIPTLFVRDFDNGPRYVTRDVTPGCEWVLNGEGVATQKFDGTCVMFDGSRWWARREVKPGKKAPAGFQEIDRDAVTGKAVGWEPAEQSPFLSMLVAALADVSPSFPRPVFNWNEQPPGTYELIGPKINGNPEQVDRNMLVRHGTVALGDVPLDYDGLAQWLGEHTMEGIVWHHPDGRMAKIKQRDFLNLATRRAA